MAFEGVKAVLLDIEGTVCSISFVKDVLFPYALDSLSTVLSERWEDAEFQSYRQAFPEPFKGDREAFEGHVRELMAKDVKVGYLKSLQGYIWRTGYLSSALQAPLYPDVPPAILYWNAHNLTVSIYSSGSVDAQKLVFQHTDYAPQPDLRPLLNGYYDTLNAGSKTEKASYTKIAELEGLSVDKWLFLSDNVKEVDAALEAGMKCAVIVRPGNPPLTEEEQHKYIIVRSFEEVTFTLGDQLQ